MQMLDFNEMGVFLILSLEMNTAFHPHAPESPGAWAVPP